MVVGKPYIHFKINNEAPENTLDYNHTWATTVETNKGPINTPILVTSASEAKNIFNVDMRPYFAQGASSLIMVRVAASSINNEPQKGVFNFNTAQPVRFAIAEQATIKKTVNGTNYVHELFYIQDNGEYKAVIKFKDTNGKIVPDVFVDKWSDDGVATSDANKYDINRVKPVLVPKYYTIPTGTSLIELKSIYEGDYDITVSCAESLTAEEVGHYNIYISEPEFGTISIRNAYDLSKIVARINNANFNVVASLTEDGVILNAAMHTETTAIDQGVLNIDESGNILTGPVGIAPPAMSVEDEDDDTGSTTTPSTSTSVPSGIEFITSDITKNSFITLAKSKTDDNDVKALTNDENTKINEDKANKNVDGYTEQATREILPYAINFDYAGTQLLSGGNNGEWDNAKQRIPTAYQADAHRAGLKSLQRVRLAGVFCMYGEELIQREYLQHGINDKEPEKGMNNNETCKWRTILLGANGTDRTDTASLIQKAVNINNQYVLLLGQGLIDSGMTGYASTLSATDRNMAFGFDNVHYLLPYECTQYIAGLRGKLEYYESIFGGQGRKRIRSIGSLDIAPLLVTDDAYEWNPNVYIKLNEAGVLTFTEEYGNITLTDGVTTIQSGFEEDEEGVMNILKYAENAIYDVCLPYIGRNINADLENSINMDVEAVLSAMRDNEQSLVDTDEYSAYTVNISLGSRSNQLLGRIYIYLTITPVHALRQIEVEMTVQ